MSDAASRYVTVLNWRVFPCKPHDKTPLTRHGFKDASCDADHIATWWTDHPTANIGVPTGATNGIVVIDLDAKNDIDPDAILGELEARFGKLPATVEQLTGGGGRQLFFQHPGGVVPNATAWHGTRGVDIRGDGGYVVVPPSVHPSGRAYQWELTSDPFDGSTIAPLPERWVDALRAKKTTVTGPRSSSGTAILNGQRNDTLFRKACVLRSAGLNADDIFAELAVVNRTLCESPLSQIEVRRIAESAANYQPTRHLTDAWAADRFALLYGDKVRWTAQLGFMVWTGKRWERDATLELDRLLRLNARSLLVEASQEPDEKTRKALVAFAQGLESNHKIQAVKNLIKSAPPVPIRIEELDADPWLLNCKTGILDLRTGALLEHAPELLLTKVANAEFRRDATCPRFIAFLDRIFNGNADLIAFAKRALGHAASGAVNEHALHVLHGTGCNGKTVLVEIVRHVLGDYAAVAPPNLLMTRFGESHPTEMAALRGVRFAVASESAEGAKLNLDRMKRLTGGDSISARFMRQDFFEFPPTHKLFLSTNHRPVVNAQDHGTWRRIKLWPFVVTIPPDEQDPRLLERLQDEADGILRWLVEGCLEWQATGLAEPDIVRAAVQDYQAESDAVGQFLETCCEPDPTATASASALSKAFAEFARAGGFRTMTQTAFGKELSARGFDKGRDPATGRVVRVGIRLCKDATSDG